MKVVEKLVAILTSLRLTVVCLVLAMVLVFIGTLAQVDVGLWEAQARYFRSFFVFWSPAGSDWKIPVFPGGYLIGAVLLTNLIAAHIARFRYTRQKAGLILVHAGLILLLIGQLFTEIFQVESYMRIREGETRNYSESNMRTELVVIDRSQTGSDTVISFGQEAVASGAVLSHPELPFDLRIRDYLPNSEIEELKSGGRPASSRGFGERFELVPRPTTKRMDSRNLPSAIVEVVPRNGEAEGTWLLSTWFDRPQPLQVDGRQYAFDLRFKRYYKPFSITLLDFRHDKYPGTEIPRNFSSRIRLQNPSTGEDREYLIYMNNPLRYHGETYYQASFDRADPRVTVLQVVRNPSWLIPYISCSMIGAGLLLQFLTHLGRFLKKRKP